ncbi:MAG TPA: dihydrodipicolinate synthase family protein [Pseudonocardiaceae bacterium]|nr:dihydrodipicolinate synthase family protein [Pseudonocardiaceae bacterium]
MNHVPWHGVVVATALPLRDDLSPDYERYADHVRWLLDNGCDGVCPNGSLGEYQTLSDVDRATVVRTAVEVAGPDRVLPGVSAYGSGGAVAWARQAAEAGCQAVMCLPPNTYRAEEAAVIEHFRAVATVGLPVVAYNNPYDTRVDLTPELLAKLHGEGLISAVKEFSGDVRRGYQIAELAPGLELLIGADDVVVELAMAGAVGWIAGFPNSLPAQCVAMYKAATGPDPTSALPAYRALHPLLRWDSRTEFVQAIKLSMDVAGRYGGPCRPPRLPLAQDIADDIRLHTDKVLG